MAVNYYVPVSEKRVFDGGLPYFEIWLSNWGNMGAAAQPNFGSVLYPSGLPVDRYAFQDPVRTYAGAAIGPESTVNEVLVCYQMFQPTPAQIASGWPFDQAITGRLMVSPQSPISSGIAGRLAIMHSSFAPKPLPLLAQPDSGDTTLFMDTYLPIGATVPAVFGTALPPGIFETPVLQLFLYPNGFPVSPPKRAILYRQAIAGYTAAQNVEQILRVFPVAGRKRIRIVLRQIGSGTQDLRVTLVGQLPAAGAPDQFQTIEEQYGAVTLNAASAQYTLHIFDPQYAFLVFYGKHTTAGAPTLVISMQAED